MLNTLRRSAADFGGIDCLGVDTWGVDFALLGRGGTLLGNPRHYRDPHTEGIMEAVFARVPRQEIFRPTGLQFMRFNTLFQLAAMQRDRSPLLEVAETLLFIPDLFNYLFTGIKVNEFTDASTSQMLDPTTKGWAYGLLQALGLPAHLPGSLVFPGTVLGPLRAAVATEWRPPFRPSFPPHPVPGHRQRSGHDLFEQQRPAGRGPRRPGSDLRADMTRVKLAKAVDTNRRGQRIWRIKLPWSGQ
jgi:sugar (pentulose or hexulose) kinase